MLASSLKTGTVFKEDNHPFLVVKYEHTKTARGGATVKVRSKNLITGQVLEKRYQSNSKVEDADVMRKNAQYLYTDGTMYYFMDPDNYSQFEIDQDSLGETANFLQEGENVQVLYFEQKPISIELPNTMVFIVKSTSAGYKGNTVSTVLKEAELENGTNVKVPTFIKNGDKIKVDTRTGEYVSKA